MKSCDTESNPCFIENTTLDKDFGGDNPFATGSTAKDAADKKNEERECHILVHKTWSIKF